VVSLIFGCDGLSLFFLADIISGKQCPADDAVPAAKQLAGKSNPVD